MDSSTLVATANVLCTLDVGTARDCLTELLDHHPELVGLQEWGLSRRRSLRVPGYTWAVPGYGGCVVGARTDRYRLLGHRSRILGWFGRSDPGVRPAPLLPPRVATVAQLFDRATARTVTIIDFHLVPGVQSRGRYRDDRPLLAARHRLEVHRLHALVEEQLALGHVVYAVGDSNFDGLRLPGLISAWEGRESDPRGTLGSARKIDDVFGAGPATTVTLLENTSDHKAVLVLRPDSRAEALGSA